MIDYEPTEKQWRFHRSEADEVLFGGAAGGGKSLAVVMDALLRCLETPGLQCYLFRRTYRELEDSLILQAYKMIPAGLGDYAQTKHDWAFSNGSCMHFRHCETEADRFRYQGAEIHALYIDELTHFSQEVYEFLRSRLRIDRRMGVLPVARYTTNPGGRGHAWVKQRFVDVCPAGEVFRETIHSAVLGKDRVHTRLYIPANVLDNVYIDESYVHELEQKPKKLRDTLLLGRWDVFEGQVFDEWRDDPAGYQTRCGTHVIAPFALPASWPRYRAFDWGYAKPFAVLWFAVGERGEAYLYREWYGSAAPDEGLRMHPKKVAKEIRRIERAAGEKPAGIADPAIWASPSGQSVAGQMEEEGVFFRRADNARIAGKMQFHKRLAFEDGLPLFYCFNTCRQFIRTLPLLLYDDANVEDVDTRGEDHAYDAARYFFMERPLTPKKRRKLALPPIDPFR